MKSWEAKTDELMAKIMEDNTMGKYRSGEWEIQINDAQILA